MAICMRCHVNKLKISPFVKWAGGKRQLLGKLEECIPESYNRYFEPFIGGGALLLDVQPERAVINDINEQLLNVYRQLKFDAEAVIKILSSFDSVECDKNYYLLMRESYNKKIVEHVLDAECAALTIWINKHCFNGLYRVNSHGIFNVPYNNKVGGTSMSEENLRSIGYYLNKYEIEIRGGDFEAACADVHASDFVYFDPPYIPISETANFTDYAKDGFGYDDHCRLASLFRRLDALGVKVMMSNHNVALVYQLYEGFKIKVIDVRRAINRDASKRVGKEVIITNY